MWIGRNVPSIKIEVFIKVFTCVIYNGIVGIAVMVVPSEIIQSLFLLVLIAVNQD